MSSDGTENSAIVIQADENSDQNSTLNDHFATSEPQRQSTNYLSDEQELNGDTQDSDRPTKRRRISASASLTPKLTSKVKPISPPWKKVAAEGPTSFTQDGRRKSGRVNSIPIELNTSSSKRQTRGTYKVLSSTPSAKDPKHNSSSKANGITKKSLSTKNEIVKSVTKSIEASKHSTTSQQLTSSALPVIEKRSHKKGEGKKATQAKSRRSFDQASDQNIVRASEDADTAVSRTPRVPKIRIRFKVNVYPPLTKLPILHPGNVPRVTNRFATTSQFFDEAGQMSVESGGLFSAEDEPLITTEQAAAEAKLVLRLEEAAQSDGILSRQVAYASQAGPYESAESRGPLRQYAHQDHLARAATEFRTLMIEEVRKHKRNAKRIAEACRDEWLRRQPKSDEELAIEARKAGELRYKSVVKFLQGTWENVRIEINNRRVKEWQVQEQIRVRKELDEAVDFSAIQLEARRARSVDDVSDTCLDEDSNCSDDTHSDNSSMSTGRPMDDESNMSFSESDSDFDRNSNDEQSKHTMDSIEDEKMTVEELRAKYADIPDHLGAPLRSDREEVCSSINVTVTPDASDMLLALKSDGHDDDDKDSDESIDMDDEMDDSDDESESDLVSDEQDSDEEGERSLLGFFALNESVDIKTDQQVQSQYVLVDTHSNLSHTRNVGTHLPSGTGGAVDDMADDSALLSEEAPATLANLEEDADTAEGLVNFVNGHHQPDMDLDVETAEHSSIPTPNTSETKPTESDSASSVELQHISASSTPKAQHSVTSIKTPVPSLLRGTLREYQHYGLDWLAGLYATKSNGILADEMGLGKTIQTIALLAHLACEHHVWGTHLVIVPTSVILNWEIEFKKFCPGFKILSYYGTQEERRRKRIGWNTEDTWNVVITSYQVVVQDHQVFRRRKWHYMILDEAHNIKNFKSKRWQTMVQFSTEARLLLTGTPLQNNLTELWSLLFFLMPGDKNQKSFASLQEYNDWFSKPQEQILENGRETMTDESRARIAKLHTILRPYLLRRLKADVEKQMPGKYEHVEWCRLSRRQRELYDGFLSRSNTRETLASGNYMSIIGCLMQLRKVCNHPDLFEERPILSSFPMKKSIIADFEIKDFLVRRRLLREHPMDIVSLKFLNMVPTLNEHLASITTERSGLLTAQRALMDLREAQRTRAQNALFNLDPASIKSNLAYLESSSRWGRFEELQHCVYLNALRRQQKPIYGSGLVRLLTIPQKLDSKPRPRPLHREKISSWLWSTPRILESMTPSLYERSNQLQTTIQKFACITPPIITPDALPIILSHQGLERFQTASDNDQPDAFHEARMKLSIQFPDKRLLQYDCGKLQTLDRLLRRLQAGGHRALIFTQMTKVLDILEQFLNIHGHRYLRLDGSTKIEHRQVLTDRFNNDDRILAFILSSRSGGMGINLTGADTVIFYDMDWNPAMDKQCQDRAHRIGQLRDVHIYRLVSEHTIEANILRKANQKRMLDDVVIQEGEFTTDQMHGRIAPREVAALENPLSDSAAAANAAMDRVLGGAASDDNFAQAEDQEDVAAAKVAQQEVMQADADDFEEPTGAQTPSANDLSTTVHGVAVDNAHAQTLPKDGELDTEGKPIKSIDDYMLLWMAEQMKDTPIQLPKDKRRDRHGKRDRSHRAR